MDEKNRECSKFQGVLLGVVKSKLNLMLMEVGQLHQNGQEIDFENHQVLIKTILKKIADKKITSAHISSDEAQCFISIFDEMDSHTEKRLYNFDPDHEDGEKESNIYSDSPFN